MTAILAAGVWGAWCAPGCSLQECAKSGAEARPKLPGYLPQNYFMVIGVRCRRCTVLAHRMQGDSKSFNILLE